MRTSEIIAALKEKVKTLEAENAALRKKNGRAAKASASAMQHNGASVKVPAEMEPLFRKAEESVRQYFTDFKWDPSKAAIEINDERYVLVRASALSKDFLDSILKLYADRGEQEAFSIGRNFLFDISHAIGLNDAKAFHTKMNLVDPLAKLSAGPVHFAYTGWAYVDILPESSPSPDENFYLVYHHPFSFEADAWIRAGAKSKNPVCIMNGGYSSGWCEESFGVPLTAVEVSCRAQGHDQCTFIMSPPEKIEQHVRQFAKTHRKRHMRRSANEIPTFFLRKTVEEQMEKARVLAEESSRAKSDFVANMSHELRTPLSAILGYTDLLKKTKLSTMQHDYLEAIYASGSNLLSTINDIMDLSKLDARKISFESVPIQLPDLLQSIELMLASRLGQKKLRYTSSVSPALQQPLLGDSVRLTQILLNIIGNAIKFTEKGRVSIHAEAEQENPQGVQVLFRITDTGIGIAADKLQIIFERFTQADSAITRKYGGTGLGLAITRELVELQGGSITVKSEEKKGTEFTVRLPFLKAAMPAEGRQQPAATVSGDGRHVLVVEDNVLNQKMTRIMLLHNGFRVSVADNGLKAIAFLKKNKVDLVLMDLQIPGMDGYLTTEKIRKTLQLHTPIIAITAHAFSGEREKCIAAGMTDYLPKPFREHELMQAIAACSQQRLIDLSFLREQTHNNTGFIKEMVRTFLQQTPKDLAALHKALQRGNGEAVYKIAHTLRTSVGFFGLQQHIGDDLLYMEKNRTADEPRFLHVKHTCEEAMEELKQLKPSALSSAT